ncbi:hypothetical protein HUJ05_007598 [Dendroctonus ponderosae]|nr:hypothetical protein HUJ05_007598 [Dendroctonus ponderosae]
MVLIGEACVSSAAEMATSPVHVVSKLCIAPYVNKIIKLVRCKLATDLMTKKVFDENIDFTLGQEPNKNSRVDFSELNKDSFINLNNKHLIISSGSRLGFVYVELDTIAVVSCYFFPNGRIEDFNNLLFSMEIFLRHLKKNVIIAGGLNGKTNFIESTNTNQRGKPFEDWIMANNLSVINQGSTIPSPQKNYKPT